MIDKKDLLWRQRKLNNLKLPWTFTVYSFSADIFCKDYGVFTKIHDEIRLYRIMDIRLKRSFWQRIMGMGTLVVTSSDKSTPSLEVVNILKPKQIRKLFSDTVEESRRAHGVFKREIIE